MNLFRKSLKPACAAVLFLAPAFAQTAALPCAGLPPGKHALLERFTEQFSLTCEQQLKVEPLLHAEESVSKPLLAFSAFSPEERQATMLKIKLAARRQVKTVLNPEQQKLMDGEIDSVAKTGSRGSGGKKANKKAPPKVDPFDNEEALSRAISNYAALTPGEKTSMVLEVKRAALRDNSLGLTGDQQKKLAADIKQLSKS